MKLVGFVVTNFRSVKDSGPIEVSKITTLVGRNESGKTNLLLGLQTLNPVGGPKDLSPITDFPRDRKLSDCTDDTPVVETLWEFDEAEQRELAKIFPRATGVKQVSIGRGYKAATRWVHFMDLKPLELQQRDVASRVRKISPVALAAAEKLEAEPRKKLEEAVARFEAALTAEADVTKWATAAIPAIAVFRKALAVANYELPAKQDELLTSLEEIAQTITADEKAEPEARKWVIARLPVFIYVDEYPDLNGHQNIAEYLQRKAKGQPIEADKNFEKLCKVADLNPQQLQDLLGRNDIETRNQLVNRAGALVTSEIRRLWKDRPLKVRFNLDANHLDALISDPNATYDVEVNLNERSRGFKWFFSFYITFAADTQGGAAAKAILLLDEPGLYLHATSQGDLLAHLAKDFDNQFIYTTHSPFMVPTDNLDAIRTVNIDQRTGTTVTNDPTGDARTLFPLQAALGFNLAQSLFVGPANLVIEGVTDYWVMATASDYLHSIGRRGLPKDLTLTPAGGAQKVAYMVALLTSEQLHVLVMLDDERQSRGTKDELVKQKLIRDDNVIFVTEAFGGTKPSEADLADILDPDVYKMLVEKSYANELKGKVLALNNNIPRIEKRYEEAFNKLGIEFFKTRPASLLLRVMATDPTKIMTASACDRFERLFDVISERFKKHVDRDAKPFR